MPFYFGLDLGQINDNSAGVVVEAHGAWDERTYDVRYIEQFPLATPYPAIVQAIGATLDRAPLIGECTLCVDFTGVGRPVGDMFTVAQRDYIGVTITGGTAWHIDPENAHQWFVSKIMLVGTVQKFLQAGRLRIGATLAHATTLQKELRDFRVKISKAATETYDAREGAHDDIVLALAIALFVAEHQGPPAQDIDPREMQRIWREAGIGQVEPPDQPMRPQRFMRQRYW
jgi:hypothetical protein